MPFCELYLEVLRTGGLLGLEVMDFEWKNDCDACLCRKSCWLLMLNFNGWSSCLLCSKSISISSSTGAFLCFLGLSVFTVTIGRGSSSELKVSCSVFLASRDLCCFSLTLDG